jgi:cytidylate kinase
MQPAEDAEVIDTSELEVDGVVDRIETLVRSRLPA